MSYPRHPEAILVKNEYYPNGLKEIDVWNYYQAVKDKLILETSGRDLMIFIAIDVNRTTVLRRGKTTSFVRLNRSNFDDVFHPRMLSIHSTMHSTEPFGIVDIDGTDFKKNRQATIDTCDYIDSKLPFVDSSWVKFTGKNSFHIICNFKRDMDVDRARLMFRRYLENSELNRNYIIDQMRRVDKSVPNLDLSSNKYRGGFITLHSLSTIGLRSMKVDASKVRSFKKEDAIIKTI